MYKTILNNSKFTVMSWNILADSLAEDIDWDTRKDDIFNMITNINADIIALQEVDKYNEFVDLLGDEYQGYYIQKIAENDKTIPTDGSCLFVRKSKFKILHIMDELIIPGAGGQVFIQMKLESVQKGNVFHIITTHLKSKSRFEKNRVNQINVLLKRIEDVHDPCIICGDLNAFPHSKPLSRCYEEGFKSSYSYELCDCLYWTIEAPSANNLLLQKTVDYILYRGPIVPLSIIKFFWNA